MTNPSPAFTGKRLRPLRLGVEEFNRNTEHPPISVWTVRRRIADGTLTEYRYGPKHLLVDLDELDQLVTRAGGDRVAHR